MRLFINLLVPIVAASALVTLSVVLLQGLTHRSTDMADNSQVGWSHSYLSAASSSYWSGRM